MTEYRTSESTKPTSAHPTRSRLTVVHCISSMREKDGGPTQSISSLCAACDGIGSVSRVVLATSEIDSTVNVPDTVTVLTLPRGRERAALLGHLRNFCSQNGALILHEHGQWLAVNRAAYHCSMRLDIPRIVSPRGMLLPWALDHRRFRKQLAWAVYASRHLQAATALHATSDLEAKELRRLGLKQPVGVIPNIVRCPSSVCRRRSADRPYALFLSRIHKKKGLPILLQAWARSAPSHWRLVIAGVDETGYMRSAGLPKNTEYVGHVVGHVKWRLLEEASLFILPTYSENFGMAVAEAMLAGVPVITTHNAPWQSLEAENAGWWIPMTYTSVAEAISKATRLPAVELWQMGQRGRTFASHTFSPEAVGAQMGQLYSCVADGSPPPPFVL